jgi:hypothetical protein
VAFLTYLRSRRRFIVSTLAGVLLVHAAPALSVHPYELAHFNLVAGGPSVAKRAIVVGWGEGLDEAAEDLSGLPDAAGSTIASTRVIQFEDFFAGRTVRIEDSTLVRSDGVRPDYVLFYISNVQTGQVPDVWARYKDQVPFYLLDINGIPYIRVYRVAP